MPVIPHYTGDTSVPIASPNATASPDLFTAPLAAAGQLGTELEGALGKIQAAERYNYLANNWMDATASWHDKLDNGMKQAEQNGTVAGFAKQFNDEIDADMQARLKGAPDQHSADQLMRRFSTLRTGLVERAATFEHGATVKQWQDDTAQNLERLAVTAYRDPTTADDIYAQGASVIAGGAKAGVLPGDLDKLTGKFKAAVYGGVAKNQLENDPDQLLEDLGKGKYDAYLSVDHMHQLTEQATTVVKRNQAEQDRQDREDQALAQGQAKELYSTEATAIDTRGVGVLPPSVVRSRLVTAFGKDNGTKLADDLDQRTQAFRDTASTALMSPSEEGEVLKKYEQPSGAFDPQVENERVRLVNALNAKDAAIAKDPRSYVEQNAPQVSAAFDAAQKDPSKLPQAVSMLDAVYDRLGVRPDQRSVLTKGAAQSETGAITSAPPEQAYQTVTGLANKYGDLWPRAFGDLVKLGKLPATYQTLAAAPDSVSGQQLAEAFGQAKDLKKDMDGKDYKTIAAGIVDDPGMKSLERSLSYAPDGLRVYDSYREATLLLALRNAPTMGPDAAVRAAVKTFTSQKYDFVGDARAPAGQGGIVEQTANRALQALQAPQIVIAPPPGSALAPQRAQEIALEQARRGFWVTNSSDSGWLRMYPTGQPVMVRGDGRDRAVAQPLEVPFAGAAPSQFQAPPNTGPF